MWLQRAEPHAISGNMPWATLSLIYSCLSKLLRLQSYRSFRFKSDIIVSEYFLWAFKVCSWSRKCATVTPSTVLWLDFKCRHPTYSITGTSALDIEQMVFSLRLYLNTCRKSTPARSKYHQVHLQSFLVQHMLMFVSVSWHTGKPNNPSVLRQAYTILCFSFPGIAEEVSWGQKLSLITF